ncbi:MAG: sugar ABC transporter permease [Clostridia bacterium]|nr:sugar ABC transporter permease [Clostridia bacterium]
MKETSIKKREKKKVEESALLRGMKEVAKGKTCTTIKRHWGLYLMLLPAFVLVAIFCYAPMFGIVIAFEDFTLAKGIFESEFVGMKNFKQIFFADTLGTYRVFRNTIYISIIRIATNFPVILLFTLLVNEIGNRKAKSLVQTISYIPHFVSWIAVGGMAYNLLSVDGGLLNQILGWFGVEPIVWYSENDYWWAILAISSLWKGMGWATLIYISALGSIDAELYDACEIDGGGRIRKALSVTLPGLMNVIALQLILDVGSIMGDNYIQIMAMTNSSQSLSESTSVVGSLTFKALTGAGGYSKASAYGLIQSVIGMGLVLLTNRIISKTDSEGVL